MNTKDFEEKEPFLALFLIQIAGIAIFYAKNVIAFSTTQQYNNDECGIPIKREYPEEK